MNRPDINSSIVLVPRRSFAFRNRIRRAQFLCFDSASTLTEDWFYTNIDKDCSLETLAESTRGTRGLVGNWPKVILLPLLLPEIRWDHHVSENKFLSVSIYSISKQQNFLDKETWFLSCPGTRCWWASFSTVYNAGGDMSGIQKCTRSLPAVRARLIGRSTD